METEQMPVCANLWARFHWRIQSSSNGVPHSYRHWKDPTKTGREWRTVGVQVEGVWARGFWAGCAQAGASQAAGTQAGGAQAWGDQRGLSLFGLARSLTLFIYHWVVYNAVHMIRFILSQGTMGTRLELRHLASSSWFGGGIIGSIILWLNWTRYE